MPDLRRGPGRRTSCPPPGRILFLREPKGPGVRLDSGIYEGWDVPIYYDPILAKLIVWAEDREAACRRMAAALDEYVILGIHTTIGFLKDVVGHPEFRAGRTNDVVHREVFRRLAATPEKARTTASGWPWPRSLIDDDGRGRPRPKGGRGRDGERTTPRRPGRRWAAGGSGGS